MKAAAILFLLMFALARGAFAHEELPTESRIRALLTSHRPLAAAWGLHYAVERGLSGFGGDVLTPLERWKDGSTWEAAALRAAALDAAIVLDIDVPERLLRAAAPKVGDTLVLILAARKPAAYRDLLAEMLEHARDDDLWTAACNLLAPLRDRRLVRHLLGRVPFEAIVIVRDDTPEETWGLVEGTEIGFGGTGCGRISPPPVVGWPPRHGWTLRTTAGPGRLLVAPGREPIFAVRHEWASGGFSCSSLPSEWGRSYDASAHLADVLGADLDRLRSYLCEYTDVRFRDAPALEQAVVAARVGRQQAWVALTVGCVLKGLLSPWDVLSMRPRVEVEVRDGRTVKEPPLPATLGR